jgi:hypothetical protein
VPWTATTGVPMPLTLGSPTDKRPTTRRSANHQPELLSSRA